MEDWVEVNKAKIERKFLEESIEEAKNYKWEKSEWNLEYGEHTHCMICDIPIPDKFAGQNIIYYKSSGGWLCDYFGVFYLHAVDVDSSFRDLCKQLRGCYLTKSLLGYQ